MVKAEVQETLPMLWSVGKKLANYRSAHDVTIKEMDAGDVIRPQNDE